MDYIKSLQGKKNGKLILVTAISPTPAGEGKTTTTVGLTDALNHIGKKAMLCLREPSLGPSFGMKGGAAGGGYAQVVPMEDINLHFTGDFHAITSAHNLLSALIDNHIYWGNALGIDSRRVAWRRVMDMNDRALREIVCSLGGVANGYPREAGFDITVASEVMAIFCLANDLDDLKKRLGNIIVAYTRDRKPMRASDLKAHGAMAALLKEAIAPNLVQTLEGTPAFIHGGPFANIAHGCNSVVATTTALKLADYVVTEAGFGADLGAEKFLDIKCRKAGLTPDCVVLVATIRALKMHGGVKKDDLKKEDLKALEAGMANLQRHVENVKKFGLPAVVSINRFSADTDAEIALVKEKCKALGVEALMADHWAMGGEGAADVAKRGGQGDRRAARRKLKLLYPDDMPLFEKIRTIAKEIYRANDATADKSVKDQLKTWEEMGFGKLPVCIAKTQYSFSTNPDAKGAPTGSHHPGARGAALGRRRVRRGDLRRDHDHAGPAEGAVGGFDRRRRRRQDRRVVLIATVTLRRPRSGVRGRRSSARLWLAAIPHERRINTNTRTKRMLKFYYSGAPNPTKVALFLEETGLPYEAIPVDTRKGDQHKPEFLAINPNAKVPAIVDGDVTVFDSNAILLYLAEKTGKFLPAKSRQGARRTAVVDVVRLVRRRPLFRPVGALPQLRAGEDPLRDQPLRLRGAAPLRHSRRAARQAEVHAGRHLHHRRHERLGLGAADAERAGRGRWAKFPNLKRLVDEISARPAAPRAVALKDRHKFKTEMDDEARKAMFRHMDEKVA